MIRVKEAPEPGDFDATVRQPGLSAIAELVGEEPTLKRPGPKRERVASRREDIPAKDFPPFWTEALPELRLAYGHICAYSCFYIEALTGTATADHFAPKSRQWDKVYEWNNYRLACSLINSRKNCFDDVIDPFEVDDEMFALDLIAMKAIPGQQAGGRITEINATIERLGLDRSEYSKQLEAYFHAYHNGEVEFIHLQRRAPFLAREMRRQGKDIRSPKLTGRY